jgi:hypothetical protein
VVTFTCYVGDLTRDFAQEPAVNHLARPANAVLFPNTGVTVTDTFSGLPVDFTTLSFVPQSADLAVHATNLMVTATYVTQFCFETAAHDFIPLGQGSSVWTATAATEDHNFSITVPATAAFGHFEISRIDGLHDTAICHATITWYCDGSLPRGRSYAQVIS